MTNKTSRSTRVTLSVISPLLLAMTGAFNTAAAAEAPAPAAIASVTTAISQSDIRAIEALPLDAAGQAVAQEPIKCTLYDNGGTHCAFYSSGLVGSTFTDSSIGEFNV